MGTIDITKQLELEDGLLGDMLSRSPKGSSFVTLQAKAYSSATLEFTTSNSSYKVIPIVTGVSTEAAIIQTENGMYSETGGAAVFVAVPSSFTKDSISYTEYEALTEASNPVVMWVLPSDGSSLLPPDTTQSSTASEQLQNQVENYQTFFSLQESGSEASTNSKTYSKAGAIDPSLRDAQRETRSARNNITGSREEAAARITGLTKQSKEVHLESEVAVLEGYISSFGNYDADIVATGGGSSPDPNPNPRKAIPKTVSSFENDAGYLTSDDLENTVTKDELNNAIADLGNYENLTNTPTPYSNTPLSTFINDLNLDTVLENTDLPTHADIGEAFDDLESSTSLTVNDQEFGSPLRKTLDFEAGPGIILETPEQTDSSKLKLVITSSDDLFHNNYQSVLTAPKDFPYPTEDIEHGQGVIYGMATLNGKEWSNPYQDNLIQVYQMGFDSTTNYGYSDWDNYYTYLNTDSSVAAGFGRVDTVSGLKALRTHTIIDFLEDHYFSPSHVVFRRTGNALNPLEDQAKIQLFASNSIANAESAEAFFIGEITSAPAGSSWHFIQSPISINYFRYFVFKLIDPNDSHQIGSTITWFELYGKAKLPSENYTINYKEDVKRIRYIKNYRNIHIPTTPPLPAWFCYFRVDEGGHFNLIPLDNETVIDDNGYGLLNHNTPDTLWRLENVDGSSKGWKLWLEATPSFLYNNYQLRPAFAKAIQATSPTTYEYEEEGDTNGIIYALGTQQGGAYQNAYTLGAINYNRIEKATGNPKQEIIWSPEILFDRSGSPSSNNAEYYMGPDLFGYSQTPGETRTFTRLDFKAPNFVKVKKVLLWTDDIINTFGGDGSLVIRCWGSHTGDWLKHKKLLASRKRVYITSPNCYHFDVIDPDFYRYLLFDIDCKTFTDSSSGNFQITEIEVYGEANLDNENFVLDPVRHYQQNLYVDVHRNIILNDDPPPEGWYCFIRILPEGSFTFVTVDGAVLTSAYGKGKHEDAYTLWKLENLTGTKTGWHLWLIDGATLGGESGVIAIDYLLDEIDKRFVLPADGTSEQYLTGLGELATFPDQWGLISGNLEDQTDLKEALDVLTEAVDTKVNRLKHKLLKDVGTFTFQSEGDNNGILYELATSEGAWSNPAPVKVGVDWSGLTAPDSLTSTLALTDLDINSQVIITVTHDPVLIIDFKQWEFVQPTTISLRAGSSGAASQWVIYGSNYKYTSRAEVIAYAESLGNLASLELNSWGSCSISSPHYYRYFYLYPLTTTSLSEFEVYGAAKAAEGDYVLGETDENKEFEVNTPRVVVIPSQAFREGWVTYFYIKEGGSFTLSPAAGVNVVSRHGLSQDLINSYWMLVNSTGDPRDWKLVCVDTHLTSAVTDALFYDPLIYLEAQEISRDFLLVNSAEQFIESDESDLISYLAIEDLVSGSYSNSFSSFTLSVKRYKDLHELPASTFLGIESTVTDHNFSTGVEGLLEGDGVIFDLKGAWYKPTQIGICSSNKSFQIVKFSVDGTTWSDPYIINNEEIVGDDYVWCVFANDLPSLTAYRYVAVYHNGVATDTLKEVKLFGYYVREAEAYSISAKDNKRTLQALPTSSPGYLELPDLISLPNPFWVTIINASDTFSIELGSESVIDGITFLPPKSYSVLTGILGSWQVNNLDDPSEKQQLQESLALFESEVTSLKAVDVTIQNSIVGVSDDLTQLDFTLNSRIDNFILTETSAREDFEDEIVALVGRPGLTANVTWFAGPGSIGNGDGLTAENYMSLELLLLKINQTNDNGYSITITLASGYYTTSLLGFNFYNKQHIRITKQVYSTPRIDSFLGFNQCNVVEILTDLEYTKPIYLIGCSEVKIEFGGRFTTFSDQSIYAKDSHVYLKGHFAFSGTERHSFVWGNTKSHIYLTNVSVEAVLLDYGWTTACLVLTEDSKAWVSGSIAETGIFTGYRYIVRDTSFLQGDFLTLPGSLAGIVDNQVGLSTQSLNSLSYAKANLTATIDPTVYDGVEKGYSVGSKWLNVTSLTLFVCLDNSPLGAIWSAINTLTDLTPINGTLDEILEALEALEAKVDALGLDEILEYLDNTTNTLIQFQADLDELKEYIENYVQGVPFTVEAEISFEDTSAGGDINYINLSDDIIYSLAREYGTDWRNPYQTQKVKFFSVCFDNPGYTKNFSLQDAYISNIFTPITSVSVPTPEEGDYRYDYIVTGPEAIYYVIEFKRQISPTRIRVQYSGYEVFPKWEVFATNSISTPALIESVYLGRIETSVSPDIYYPGVNVEESLRGVYFCRYIVIKAPAVGDTITLPNEDPITITEGGVIYEHIEVYGFAKLGYTDYTLDPETDMGLEYKIEAAQTIHIPDTPVKEGWFCYFRVEPGGSLNIVTEGQAFINNNHYSTLSINIPYSLWRLENTTGLNDGWRLWLDNFPNKYKVQLDGIPTDIDARLTYLETYKIGTNRETFLIGYYKYLYQQAMDTAGLIYAWGTGSYTVTDPITGLPVESVGYNLTTLFTKLDVNIKTRASTSPTEFNNNAISDAYLENLLSRNPESWELYDVTYDHDTSFIVFDLLENHIFAPEGFAFCYVRPDAGYGCKWVFWGSHTGVYGDTKVKLAEVPYVTDGPGNDHYIYDYVEVYSQVLKDRELFRYIFIDFDSSEGFIDYPAEMRHIEFYGKANNSLEDSPLDLDHYFNRIAFVNGVKNLIIPYQEALPGWFTYLCINELSEFTIVESDAPSSEIAASTGISKVVCTSAYGLGPHDKANTLWKLENPSGTINGWRLWLIDSVQGYGPDGHYIQNELEETLPQRLNLKFLGDGLVVSDDEALNVTTVDIGRSGHSIEDSEVTYSQRTTLKLVGSGVVVTDDEENDATVVTITQTPLTINDGDQDLPTQSNLTFLGDGLTVTNDDVNETTIVDIGRSGHIINDDLTSYPFRVNLKLTGGSVTITDDEGNDTTLVELGSGGHTILDDAGSLPARANLKFTGAGVTVTDDELTDTTLVTVARAGHTITGANTTYSDRSNLQFKNLQITDNEAEDTTTVEFIDSSFEVNKETLSDHKTLDYTTAPVQILNPDGVNRDVYLTDSPRGIIVNDSIGSNSLTLKASSGGAALITLNSTTNYKAAAYYLLPNSTFYIHVIDSYEEVSDPWAIAESMDSATRLALVLPVGKLVFDTTNHNVYCGDGTTLGGLLVGVDNDNPAQDAKKSKLVASVASTVNLTLTSEYFQFLNPTISNVDVVLPSVTASDYFECEIVNTGSGTNQLTIKEPNLAQIIILNSSDEKPRSVYVYWDGATWHVWIRGTY